MKSVGIIGGLGPETTSIFYLEIISSCYKKNQEARPGIIIASVPLPYKVEEDFIRENKGAEKYVPFLLKEALRLEKAGSDFIVMPCNSMHIFIEKMRKEVKIPILSIIEETVKFIKKNKYKKVGMVSTLATVQNKLYETVFEENDISYIVPNNNHQDMLGCFIMNLLKGEKKEKDREEFIKIINDFEDKGVDCIALACTDLQLLNPKHPRVNIFDTMKIFSDATVKELLNNDMK